MFGLFKKTPSNQVTKEDLRLLRAQITKEIAREIKRSSWEEMAEQFQQMEQFKQEMIQMSGEESQDDISQLYQLMDMMKGGREGQSQQFGGEHKQTASGDSFVLTPERKQQLKAYLDQKVGEDKTKEIIADLGLNV